MPPVSLSEPLPRLYLLTLEGAGEGPALAARAGVRGAEYVGPATAGAEVYFTTAIAGTPTFVALDSAGHATRVLPDHCLVLEVVEPGLLVLKHRRAASFGKYGNIAVLRGDHLRVVDDPRPA